MTNRCLDKVHHVAYITCIINGVPLFYDFSTVINFNIFSFFKYLQFLINKKIWISYEWTSDVDIYSVANVIGFIDFCLSIFPPFSFSFSYEYANLFHFASIWDHDPEETSSIRINLDAWLKWRINMYETLHLYFKQYYMLKQNNLNMMNSICYNQKYFN